MQDTWFSNKAKEIQGYADCGNMKMFSALYMDPRLLDRPLYLVQTERHSTLIRSRFLNVGQSTFRVY